MSTTYYALNRQRRTVCRVNASSWEEMQCRAVFGIMMPDHHVATGIGRCPEHEFKARAERSQFTILTS